MLRNFNFSFQTDEVAGGPLAEGEAKGMKCHCGSR